MQLSAKLRFAYRSGAASLALPADLYDMADSAHWYNRPEVGIVVWRGKEELTIVRVAKATTKRSACRGDVRVRYVKGRATFEAAQ